MPIINKEWIVDNVCFGCGHANPHGLHIEIEGEAGSSELLGRLPAHDHHAGFPGITHGGVQYTALDCLGAWTMVARYRNEPAVWILRNAEVTYSKPALVGRALGLRSRIVQDNGPRSLAQVEACLVDADGLPMTTAQLHVIPLPLEKFKRIVGIDHLPDNWQRFLAGETAKNPK